MLSKSRFLTGLQSEKRLWLSIHGPELEAPIDRTTRRVLDQGTRVEDESGLRFRDGPWRVHRRAHLRQR